MSRLVPVHNPHPGGTYIWFTVPDGPEPEAVDLGRFEPTPYDLGITDDPEATWADVQAEPEPEMEIEP